MNGHYFKISQHIMLLLLLLCPMTSQARPGDLDMSFGTRGIVTHTLREKLWADAIVQPNGKILALGEDLRGHAFVQQFNSDGTPDERAFLEGSIKNLSQLSSLIFDGNQAARNLWIPINRNSNVPTQGSTLAIQPQESSFRVLVSGTTPDYAAVPREVRSIPESLTNYSFFTTSPTPSSFFSFEFLPYRGSGRQSHYRSVPLEWQFSMPDTENPYNFSYPYMHMSHQGRNPIESFLSSPFQSDGTPGALTFVGSREHWAITDFSGKKDVAESIAVLPNGYFFVAGFSCDHDAERNLPYTNCAVSFAKYTPDGWLDLSFMNRRARVMTALSGRNLFTQKIILTPEAKILILALDKPADDFRTTSRGYYLFQYLPNGQLDPAFGEGRGYIEGHIGVLRTPQRAFPSPTECYETGENTNDYFRTFTLDARDRENYHILLGGSSNDKAAMVSYTKEGRLDTNFGCRGKLVFNDWNQSRINDLLLNSAGQIYAVGRRNGAVLVSKLSPDGRLVSDFGNNGSVTTDLSTTTVDNALKTFLRPGHKLLVIGKKYREGTRYNDVLFFARYDLSDTLQLSNQDLLHTDLSYLFPHILSNSFMVEINPPASDSDKSDGDKMVELPDGKTLMGLEIEQYKNQMGQEVFSEEFNEGSLQKAEPLPEIHIELPIPTDFNGEVSTENAQSQNKLEEQATEKSTGSFLDKIFNFSK